MTLLLAFLFLQDAPDAARFEDATKEVQWARSVEEALRESRIRNVPVFLYATTDS